MAPSSAALAVNMQPFFEAVAAALPSEVLSFGPGEVQAYGRDTADRYPAQACAVAKPCSVEQVATLLSICNRHRMAVVPSGARTGRMGGAVAAHGELVLCLERMNCIDPVNVLGRTLHVQAGVDIEAVRATAAAAGLTWPVHTAGDNCSQVGGNLATNAGSIHMVRYGPARHWVLGLQVVTMAGEILELDGELTKNAGGIDLRQLFIGSEGILGVITAATLKLTVLPRHRQVAFFGVRGVRRAIELLAAARAAPWLKLLAFEFLTDDCLDVVLARDAASTPLASRCPAYVLAEIEGDDREQSLALVEEWVSELFDRNIVDDAVLAQSDKDAAELWQLRARISQTLNAAGRVHRQDIAVPVAALAAFYEDCTTLLRERYPDLAIYPFGHLGDGNLHVDILKPDGGDDDSFEALCAQADHDVYRLVQKHRGSASGEHGIGLLKKNALAYSRSAAEIALFRQIKRVFDPNGLLNPGKVLD